MGTRPVEINVSEGMQAGPTEVTGSGIKIDKNSAATIAGLFACGDACDHNRCVHGAVAGGYKAGKSAAAFAQPFQHGYQAPGSMTREQIDRFMEPLHRSSGYPYRQIEDTIRKIMAEHVGPRRTEHALTRGFEKLRRVERYLDEIKADDLHELMRTHETRSILAVGKLMATTALFRKESRNKPYHHRLDFPDSDDTNWCGLVVVRKEGDELSCTFEPVNQRPPAELRV